MRLCFNPPNIKDYIVIERKAEQNQLKNNMSQKQTLPSVETLTLRNENLGETMEDQWKLLSLAIDASNNCICITDPKQKGNPIIYVNKGFEKLTGYSREEVVGNNCRFLQADDTSQEGVTVLRQAIERGENCQVILRNYSKDGQIFWNELHLSPIYNQEGEVLYFMGVQNDISKRIQHEQNLQKAIENTFSDPSWFTTSIMDNLVKVRGGHINTGSIDELTDRERETLRLVAKGLRNNDIAERLGLSVHTVRNYLSNVYDKLNVHSRTDAAIWARKRGLGHD